MTSTAVALGGVAVALAAIIGATVAVSLGHIDSAAYTGLLGAFVGFGGGVGTGAGFARSNGAAKP